MDPDPSPNGEALVTNTLVRVDHDVFISTRTSLG